MQPRTCWIPATTFYSYIYCLIVENFKFELHIVANSGIFGGMRVIFGGSYVISERQIKHYYPNCRQSQRLTVNQNTPDPFIFFIGFVRIFYFIFWIFKFQLITLLPACFSKQYYKCPNCKDKDICGQKLSYLYHVDKSIHEKEGG